MSGDVCARTLSLETTPRAVATASDRLASDDEVIDAVRVGKVRSFMARNALDQEFQVERKSYW